MNLNGRRENAKYRNLLFFTTCFLSFSFGFVTNNTQKLQNQTHTTEMIINRTLATESYQTTTNKILSEEIFNTSSLIDALDIKDIEKGTEVNLEHVLKQLNDEDLYEHVTDKNNVSQRSLLIKPSSRYKVPRLFRYYPISLSQKTKLNPFETRLTPYYKTKDNSKIKQNEPKYDRHNEKKSFPFMIVVADGKPTKKVYFLDKPLLNKILRAPMKVDRNSANLLINEQYNNLNDDILQTERSFLNKNNQEQNGYSKDGDTKVPGIIKPQKMKNDQTDDGEHTQKHYMTNCFRNCIDANVTNSKKANSVENKYDYIELMKQALVRPADKQDSANLKTTLYNKLKQRHSNNIAPHRKANSNNHKIIAVNRIDEVYNEIDSNRPIKQMKAYPQDIDEADFHNSELAEQIQEINELGKQFNDEITQKEVDRKKGMYKMKHGMNQIKNNRYYNMKRPVVRSSCVYPDCDV